MKYIITIFLSINLVCCSPGAPTSYIIIKKDYTPSETAIFKLPNESKSQWKEIARGFSQDGGIVESIPCNQIEQNWTDLICIQYISAVNLKNVNDFDLFIESLRRETFSPNQGRKVTFTVLEKNKSDLIYETIFYEASQSHSPEHIIARLFITETGTYRVGFSRKNSQMSSEERIKWIGLLKDHVFMTSYNEASRDKEVFSLAKYTPASLVPSTSINLPE